MPIANIILGLIEQNSPDVEGLDLTQSGISDDDIELLVDAMQNNSYLKHLKLSNGRSRLSRFNPNVTTFDILMGKPLGGIEQNAVTARGVKLLMTLDKLETLDISDNPIGDEGAHILAKSNSLRELAVSNCDISVVGKFEFLANRLLTVLWVNGVEPQINIALLSESLLAEASEAKKLILEYLHANYDADSFEGFCANSIQVLQNLWEEKIEEVLCLNLQSGDPEGFQKEKLRREKQALEDAIREAVDQENLADLTKLIPQLPEGINTYLVYGFTVLQCAAKANKPRVVEFLLNHGASLEVHAREYTPLFFAAQEGHYEAFKMLLNRGANIRGEFYFNAETAFSIAAFKMNEKLFHILIRYKNYIEKLPQPCQKIAAEHQARWKTLGWADFSKQPAEQILEDGDIDHPWVCFGEDPTLTGEYSKNALILQNNLTMLAKRLNDQELQIDLQRLTELANIYRLMHDKIAVPASRYAHEVFRPSCPRNTFA